MRIQRVALLAVAVLAFGAGSLAVGAGSVSAGQASGLDGVLDCDPNTGEQIVTWTFQNFTQADADINSVSLDTSGLTAGSVTPTVTMAPDPTPTLDSSTGASTASIDAAGTLTLTVQWYNATADQFITSIASVTLLAQGTVDTTTTVVDTTVVDTTVVATTVVDSTATTAILGSGGQGNIPTTGSDPTIAWLGLAFVTAGVALLAVRRRSLRNS